MKIVYSYYCLDTLHFGHLIDLKRSKEEGGELYVVRVSGSVNLASQRELSYMANVERVFNETKGWFD